MGTWERTFIPSCTLSDFFFFKNWTVRHEAIGTSFYKQLPVPLVPAHFPLKTLFLYSLWMKKTHSFFLHTHTHTHKTGDFQQLRNSSKIAGALLSIKTWPFQHVCVMFGAMGTGEDEDRGLPSSVVVWPNSTSSFFLFLLILLPPKKTLGTPTMSACWASLETERTWHKSGYWVVAAGTSKPGQDAVEMTVGHKAALSPRSHERWKKFEV